MNAALSPWLVFDPRTPRPTGSVVLTPLPGDWPALARLLSALPPPTGLAVGRLSDLHFRLTELQALVALLQANRQHVVAHLDGLDTRLTGYHPLLAAVRAVHAAQRQQQSDAIRRGQQASERPVGRRPYLDPAKAERVRLALLAGRKPWFIRRRLGVSNDTVRRIRALLDETL